MRRRPRRVTSYDNFAREFNPGYHSAANRAARRAYTASWFARAARIGSGLGAIGAAAAANFFQRVPKLDTQPITMPRIPKRSYQKFLAGQKLIGTPNGGKNKDPSGSYVQYRKASATVGKALGEVDKLKRLLYAHACPVIDRFQYLTGIKTTGGAYNLTYWNDTVGGRYNMPYYVFDLTSVFNLVGSNDQPTNITGDPYPFQRLARLTSNGRYAWATQSGKTNANVDAFNWQTERSPVLQTTQAVQRERNLIEWCDIRLLIYGARAAPTTVEVMIVQFKDEELVPEAVCNLSTGGVTALEPDSGASDATKPLYARWQTTWQGEVDRLLLNPMQTRGLKEQQNIFDVKYSKTFTFNPTGAETDDNGHQVEFRLKYLMNKVCDYVNFPTEYTEVPAANESNVNYWPQYNEHMYSPFVKPKGREYVLIRALAPTLATADVDVANAASFDLMIRRKHTRMIR